MVCVTTIERVGKAKCENRKYDKYYYYYIQDNENTILPHICSEGIFIKKATMTITTSAVLDMYLCITDYKLSSCTLAVF